MVLVDILVRILQRNLMERINLNVPPEIRARIRALAKASRRTEGEVTRELVVRALDQIDRAAAIEAIKRAQTPEHVQRVLEIANAMERLRSPLEVRRDQAKRRAAR